MSFKTSIIFTTLTVIILSGCTNRFQIRGIEPENNTAIGIYDLEKNPTETCKARKDLESRCIEKLTTNGQNNEVSIGIIEVNDRGVVNNAQKKQFIDHLKSRVIEKLYNDKGLLLVVFMHGWHHNAHVCDYNLSCFRNVLLSMKKLDELKNRNVVGLYVGWRGESINFFTNFITNNISVWTRKDAAENIGKTGVKDLLLELDNYVDELKLKNDTNEPVTMISIGHSLGGAMLLSAAREKMVGYINGNKEEYIRSTESLINNTPGVKPLRQGLGDLAILVNPAIEARKWEVFDNDMKSNGMYRNGTPVKINGKDVELMQLPTIVALSSKADLAVGLAFPLARIAEVIWKPCFLFLKSKVDTYGIGHFETHVTHDLKLEVTEKPKQKQETNTYSSEKPINDTIDIDIYKYKCNTDNLSVVDQKFGENCGCPKKLFIGNTEYKSLNINSNKKQIIPGSDDTNIYNLIYTSRNKQNSIDTYSPYILVLTDDKIISEHNDIFNEHLISFITAFTTDYIKKNKDIHDKKPLPNTSTTIEGNTGVDGKDGKDGVDGKDGKDGVDGKDGKDGVDGKDCKDSNSFSIAGDNADCDHDLCKSLTNFDVTCKNSGDGRYEVLFRKYFASGEWYNDDLYSLFKDVFGVVYTDKSNIEFMSVNGFSSRKPFLCDQLNIDMINSKISRANSTLSNRIYSISYANNNKSVNHFCDPKCFSVDDGNYTLSLLRALWVGSLIDNMSGSSVKIDNIQGYGSRYSTFGCKDDDCPEDRFVSLNIKMNRVR